MAQESSQITPRYLTGDKAGLQKFLAKFDVFLFDCDGLSPVLALSRLSLRGGPPRPPRRVATTAETMTI
ncbi:hypothetical protein PENSOL_c035G08298 [Penicillium solitum]|uniref:Uncharacterized protein n=1 Tax=Penicillium solitum TaxID=60172 RepID=A0A1V6QV75_9EURO|nr:uncharacterized protein PENSOL_c035G08298 [Penicillium solitum]OQD93114.1 hypothetical protein PENSOL_c035G08298 [Penicillium solitum]